MTVLFLAFKNLFRYKKRLILNLLLVFFSTIFLIYCITIINTNRNTGKLSVVNTITGHLSLKPEQNPDDLFGYIAANKMRFFSKEDFKEITKNLDAINTTKRDKIYEAISKRTSFNAIIFKKEKSTPCLALGINPSEENNLSQDLSIKNYFLEPNSIITSGFIAEKFNLKIGDKVTIMNKTVRDGTRSMSFVFRGIIKPKVLMDQNIQPLVYINIDYARYLLDLENQEVTEIVIRLDEKYYRKNIINKIRKRMDIINSDQKIKLIPFNKQIYFLEGSLKTGFIMAYSEAGIFIIIMLVGLLNITAINFRTQKKEIGTFIVLGMTPIKVFLYFLLQTLILITIGYLVGFTFMSSVYFILIKIFKNGISLARVEILQYAYGGKIIYPKLDFPGMFIGYIIFILSGFVVVFNLCKKASKIKVLETLKEDII